MILVLVLLAGTPAFAQFRIATLDLNRVVTNYWKTTRAQSALDDQKAKFDSSDQEKLADFNKAKEEYQKVLDSVNDPAISSDERERREKDAEAKLRGLRQEGDDIQEFERGEKAALYEKFARTHDNIVSDIRTVVNARAQTDGYTLVIDASSVTATGTPMVLYYVPGTNDLTDAVIKQINAGAPVDTPKPDEKSPAAQKDTK